MFVCCLFVALLLFCVLLFVCSFVYGGDEGLEVFLLLFLFVFCLFVVVFVLFCDHNTFFSYYARSTLMEVVLMQVVLMQVV